MTAVLAGAVGGLLALAGGFLVQALGDRERRKARARSLVAAYLADLQRVLVENARRMHPDGNGDLLDALTALDVAFRSGGELAPADAVHVHVGDRVSAQVRPQLLDPFGGAEQAVLLAVPANENDRAVGAPAVA